MDPLGRLRKWHLARPLVTVQLNLRGASEGPSSHISCFTQLISSLLVLEYSDSSAGPQHCENTQTLLAFFLLPCQKLSKFSTMFYIYRQKVKGTHPSIIIIIHDYLTHKNMNTQKEEMFWVSELRNDKVKICTQISLMTHPGHADVFQISVLFFFFSFFPSLDTTFTNVYLCFPASVLLSFNFSLEIFFHFFLKYLYL